uniref:uncharacterized protein LOC114671100 n=1 Tax=Macaca mulatta TaxID=9544 RepID=UPI0010A24CCF|nr:uncharacterized protein LOC114671100 [Macaca mulatta]
MSEPPAAQPSQRRARASRAQEGRIRRGPGSRWDWTPSANPHQDPNPRAGCTAGQRQRDSADSACCRGRGHGRPLEAEGPPSSGKRPWAPPIRQCRPCTPGIRAAKLVPGVSVHAQRVLRHSRRQDSGSRSLHSSRVRWDRRAERGRGSSCLASHNQHPGFRRVPLLGLGRLRCLGAGEAGASSLLLGCRFEIALNPLTRPVLASHCPSFCLLFGRSVCFLSLGMSISLFLIILAVSVCSLSCCLPYLALSLCIGFSVSLCVSLPPFTSLHLTVSLFTNASLCLCLYFCLSPTPFPSSIPILWVATSGDCSSPTGQPGDASGHCPGFSSSVPRVLLLSAQGPPPGHLHMPVTSAQRWSSRRGCGTWRGAREGRHRAQHLLGSPGAPDPLCHY